MKERLLALVGTSVDITIIQRCFLDKEKYMRACMFGILHKPNTDEDYFRVLPDECSPHSIEFTADMVTNLQEGVNHSLIRIKLSA